MLQLRWVILKEFRIDFCETDDWQGVYINGEIHMENHSLSTADWLQLLITVLIDEGSPVVRRHYVDYDWIESGGHFPRLFEEFPEDVLETYE